MLPIILNGLPNVFKMLKNATGKAAAASEISRASNDSVKSGGEGGFVLITIAVTPEQLLNAPPEVRKFVLEAAKVAEVLRDFGEKGPKQ